MKNIILALSILTLIGCESSPARKIKNDLRAPAYPLITIDPYTSAWSITDNLYESDVKHWTGKNFPLLGAIRVEGRTYRFMGEGKTPMLSLIPMSTDSPWQGQYTFTEPKKGWEKTNFNDRFWTSGEAAFGTPDELNVKTLWETKDIWVRRTIALEDQSIINDQLFLKFSHDDIFELYINGIEMIRTGYEWRKDVIVPLSDEIKASIKDGKIVIAAHCHNRMGGGLVDFGIYRNDPQQINYEIAVQKSVDVQATQTYYRFECGPIDLDLTFTAPLLMSDLELVSRPVNYISYTIKSNDKKAHDVAVYFEASPAWALNTPGQPCKSECFEKDNLILLKSGSQEQAILGRKGDDVRIDWGYFYLASNKTNTSCAVGNPADLRQMFATTGKVHAKDSSKNNYMALVQTFNKITDASDKIMLGYDDIYSVQYFGENLRPYWNRKNDKTIEEILIIADKNYDEIKNKCDIFDNDLMKRAVKAGGKEYAELCALAYRQAIAAHKLVEAPNGDLLFLSKENFSNGSIGTVDITYPSTPLFLIYNPELAKGLLNHIFYYSESGKWTKPFPAHDIGTYPLANGQTYQGDMPVEEAGNMLIISAAITSIEKNTEYVGKHWNTLTTWADYLVKEGLDPDNQLCTDDFAGHFAHNANLSIKAILGIYSYGYMADRKGDREQGQKYMKIAKEMAQEWEKMAADGDHYALTFDQKGTWSQKYNIVWDKVLDFNIFPDEIVEKEIPFYLTKQQVYGLPLDSRKNYTKSDWIVWTATLAPDDETFQKFITPMYNFMNETTERIPMSDWYNTDRKTHVGFQARSVVGGYFMKMLDVERKK